MKRILILGAGSGLGKALADEAYARGHAVCALVHTPRQAELWISGKNRSAEAYPIEYLDIQSFLNSNRTLIDGTVSWDAVLFSAAAILPKSDQHPSQRRIINHLAPMKLLHFMAQHLTSTHFIEIGTRLSLRYRVASIDFSTDKQKIPTLAYAEAKWMNLAYLRAISPEFPQHQFSAFMPGLIRTAIGNKHLSWSWQLLWNVLKTQAHEPAHVASFLIEAIHTGQIPGGSCMDMRGKSLLLSDLVSEEDSKRVKMWTAHHMEFM